MKKEQKKYPIKKIIELVELWLIKGELVSDILDENFRFISPFWQSNDKAGFVEKFQDPTTYKETSLSNIVKFDPLIRFKDIDGDKYFAIILQYHTKNGGSVWESVLGTVSNGLLIELRSIYDLESTKKAHNLL